MEESRERDYVIIHLNQELRISQSQLVSNHGPALNKKRYIANQQSQFYFNISFQISSNPRATCTTLNNQHCKFDHYLAVLMLDLHSLVNT